MNAPSPMKLAVAVAVLVGGCSRDEPRVIEGTVALEVSVVQGSVRQAEAAEKGMEIEPPLGATMPLGEGHEITFEGYVSGGTVHLTGQTTLPEGTRYRMHPQRRLLKRDPPAIDGEGAQVRRVSSHAAEFRPRPRVEVHGVPSRLPFLSLETFGEVVDGRAVAELELASVEMQFLYTSTDDPEVEADRQHLFVLVSFEREAQPPALREDWPFGDEPLTFTLVVPAPVE